MKTALRIAVVGAGAIGLLFAGRLVAAGEARVTLLTRTREQAERIVGAGLCVTEVDGVEARVAVEGVALSDAPPAAPVDWLFLTTKQTQLDDALLRDLAERVRGETRLLCFQNGIGHAERLTRGGIRTDRIAMAVTTVGARKDGPARVAFTGRGTTSIGYANGAPADAALVEIGRLLERAGFPVDLDGPIEAAVHRKLLINSIINPLTAILGVTNGELPASPPSLRLMRALYEEACAALQGGALRIEESLWEAALEVCRRTSANMSSMLQDVRAGRTTEIDWINGAIVRLAKAKGGRAPTHEAVSELVRAIEGSRRSM
ncbi:2-dehydropantoate 2-reductase [Paenibacillus sp. TRM 82003]|nr:2-dehydropantoate 2-reductase [Paenibacillus sp. TRM 82003]